MPFTLYPPTPTTTAAHGKASSSPAARPAIPPATAAERVMAPVARELREVVDLFDAELVSDLPSVNQLVTHVARFRGKMLRPTLLLLTGKAVAPDASLTHGHKVQAAVMEMVHMSTLVHDDVLDDAELRRKGATINHLRGNEAAVLLGDYLISHSYHLCSRADAPPPLEPQWAAQVVARTTNRLCEGELLQVHNRANLGLDENTYYEIVRRKTGALTGASCLIGARFAGADEALGDALYRYGELIGMAFQVQDDVLDLAGDIREVGKTLGVDAEKQKLTLPVIHFLKTAPREHRELLVSLLRGNDPDRSEQVRQLIGPSDAIDHARSEARRLTTEAAACLEGLPPSEARAVLLAICDFVIGRAA